MLKATTGRSFTIASLIVDGPLHPVDGETYTSADLYNKFNFLSSNISFKWIHSISGIFILKSYFLPKVINLIFFKFFLLCKIEINLFNISSRILPPL